jgi:hypothetical protein
MNLISKNNELLDLSCLVRFTIMLKLGLVELFD